MKKHVLLAMAVIMVLGSIKALAMSDLQNENTEGKILASYDTHIALMIQDMENLQPEADQKFSEDLESQQVGKIGKFISEAETIRRLIYLETNVNALENALKQVQEMRSEACLIVRGNVNCSK